MARQKPRPSNDTITLNPLWFKVGAGFLAVAAMVAVICYFEGVNRHVQADRRLSRDPLVARWYQDTKALVAEEGGAAGSNQPVALWYGRVDECRNSNPRTGSAPELLAVRLADARLMAGEKGALDAAGNEIIISTRNAAVAPRVGEEWLFSVWRDEKGYNHTQSARFYRGSGG